MIKYPKIPTVWRRDPETNYKTLLSEQWGTPEIKYLSVNEWTFTEKVDGTNIRIGWDGNTVEFGGRTDRAQIPIPLVNELNFLFQSNGGRVGWLRKNFPPSSLLEGESEGGNPVDVTLFGEGYGPKIQSGGKYSDRAQFVLFDINVNGVWLNQVDVVGIASSLALGAVPIIGQGNLYDMVDIVRSGLKSNWGDFNAEGIVARPPVELLDRGGRRIIVKVKGRDF